MLKLARPWSDDVVLIVTQTFQEHLERARKMKTVYNGGLDVAPTSQQEVEILAAADGMVVKVGMEAGGYGNYVRIRHNINGDETLYAHLRSVGVKPNQQVYAGQAIGVMGSTGNSTGVHLHFEVRVGGRPVDPLGYIVIDSREPQENITFDQRQLLDTPKARPVGDLNVRSGPGVAYSIIGAAHETDILDVLGYVAAGEDVWLRVGFNQYIAAKYDGQVLVRWVDRAK